MTENEFVQGSSLLLPVATATGLPIDQVNFLVCQLVALLCGYPYRIILGPEKASPIIRHVIQLLVGVPLTLFCFGSQILHLVIQSTICLVLMKVCRPGIMEKGVFVVAMGYLCVCHIYRMYYDYGGYTLDITGPLMINTQRLTSLAYNICDGRQKDETKLSSMMKKMAVKSFPTLLEYTSYIFSFHGIMCGPFCFYKDYMAFIHGTNYLPPATQLKEESGSSESEVVAPSPNRAVLEKALAIAFFGAMSMLVVPKFHYAYMLDPAFRHSNIVYKTFFIVVCTTLARQKYYFAWGLSELVNANAGLGFNGYDARGRPKWDLISNTDFFKVEMSTSLKLLLDNWNKMTMSWLRYVVYERSHSTLAVFLFSAFWHGFYAGYYLTFLGGGFFIHASRLVRHNIRPFFQSGPLMSLLYDVITFFVTRLLIAYLTFPFVLLEFWLSIDLYRQQYFWIHIVGGLIIAVFTLRPVAKPEKKKE